MPKKKPTLACDGCVARQRHIDFLEEELRARRAAPAPPVVETRPVKLNEKNEPLVELFNEDTGLVEEMTVREYRELNRGINAAIAGKPVIIGEEDMQ